MGSKHSVEYVTDPALIKALEQANLNNEQLQEETKKMNSQYADQMRNMQKSYDDLVSDLQEENAKFLKEVEEMKRQAEKPKTEYNRIVKNAHAIVSRASRKVALVLGAQGAGKSTIVTYMFGVNGCKTGTGNTHVTTELTLYNSHKVPFALADTVGKMPDVRGIMRVMACAYNKEWDPVALIVVHTGRSGHFDAAASFLQAAKVNTINFEPRSFYRMKNSGTLDIQHCLEMTIFKDESPLPHINSMEATSFQVEECATTVNLMQVLKDLTWDKAQLASDFQGISNALAFYLAKSIVERADFAGTDLDFIDRES